MKLNLSHRMPFTKLAMCLVLIVSVLAPVGCSGKSKVDKLYDEGMLFYKHRRYYSAIDKFEDALKLQPDNTRVLLKNADSYLKTSKPEQAIKNAQQVLAKEPGNQEAALIEGQGHLALAVQNAKPGPDGSNQLDSAEMDKAAEVAAKLTKEDPNSVQGNLLQARIDYLNGKVDSAEALFRHVLETDASNSTARNGLIEALMGRQKYAEAEAMARKDLADTPKDAAPDPATVCQLALSLAYQQRYTDAYGVLEPYLSKDQKSPELQEFLVAGQVLMRHLQAIGVTALRQGRQESGAAPEAAVTSMTLVAESDVPQELEKEFKTAVEHLGEVGSAMKGFWPKLPESHFFRAVSRELEGNLDEAIKDYTEAAAGASQNKRFRLALALAEQKNKQTSQAIQDLQTLLKYHPNDFDARLALANIYLEQQENDDALPLYQALHLEQPDNAQVLEPLSRLLVMSSDPKDVETGLEYMNQLADRPGISAVEKQFIQGRRELAKGLASARQGDGAAAREAWLAAEKDFHAVLDAQPANAQAMLLLSELARQRGDLFTALNYAKQAAAKNDQLLPKVADLYQRLGQLKAAEDIYKEQIAANPNATGLETALADVQIKQGRYDDAIAIFDAAIKKHPDQPQGYINKARTENAKGDAEAAIKTLRQGLDKAPKATIIPVELSSLLMAQNQPGEVVKLLTDTLAKNQDQLALLRAQGATAEQIQAASHALATLNLELALAKMMTGAYGDVDAHAQQARQLDPTLRVQATLVSALGMLGEDKAAEAADALKDVFGAGASAPLAAPYIDALAQAAAGRKDAALKRVADTTQMDTTTRAYFTKLIDSTTPEQIGKVDQFVGLQVLLAGAAKYAPEVIGLCDQTLAVVPKDPFVLSRKAEELRLTGKPAEANAVYDELAQLTPDTAAIPSIQAEIAMNEVRQALAKGDQAAAEAAYTKAESYERRALELAPDNAKIMTQLASILQSRNKVDQANEMYRKLIQIDPKNWTAYNNLAWNQAEAGNLDDAWKTAQSAVEAAPAGGDVRGGVLDTAGWIALRRDDTAKAVELLNEAALYAPNNPDVRFHLAQALVKSGQNAGAVQQLQAILVSTPGYPKIGEVRELLSQAQGSGGAGATTATTPTAGA